jgi:hypothetical protein
MPAYRTTTDDSGPSGAWTYLLRALPVALLVGIWLWLALSAGGHAAKDWVFPAVAVGVLGAAAASLLAYPRRPRQLSLGVVAIVAAYAIWALASTLWAERTDLAWVASGRTFVYLLVLALAVAFFTSSRARVAFRHLLMGASLVLLIVCIWRLWSAGDLAQFFVADRLAFPVAHPDAAAALFLLPFWPLMWLAAGPAERAPVRGAALGLATGLIGLAFLTQSRAAAWSLGISLIIIFALSPGRLRLLFYLVAPAVLMVYAVPHLNRYWTQAPAMLGGGVAARTLTVAALAAGFIGMIVALLEGWVKVSGRMKAIFGTVVLAGCLAGLVYGGMTLTRDVGGPMAWFGDAWDRLISEPALGTSADASLGASGGTAQTIDTGAAPTRTDLWQASWQQWRQSLIIGAGADNSANLSSSDDPQAGALALNVLSDSGAIGGLLFFGVLILSIGGILWPRTAAGWSWLQGARRGDDKAEAQDGERRAGRRRTSRWGSDPMVYGWEMALVAAMSGWFVQANLVPLWQYAGITVPILLLLAAAVSATDGRAGTLWPRLSARLRRRPGGRPEGTEPDGGDDEDDRRAATRSARSKARRGRFLRGRLRPEGLLSEGFRVGLIVLSAAVLILAASAYLLESL